MFFALMGLVHSDIWVAFLLFDLIVKDPTTADVLTAIYYPRKQLGMACVLGLFVTYIHAYFYVSCFVDDVYFYLSCLFVYAVVVIVVVL